MKGLLKISVIQFSKFKLLARRGPLFHVAWHRYINNHLYDSILLDEAHSIKNKNTKGSKAAADLDALYRWCLTGTPIQNSIIELFPLMRFLRIRPYCDWTKFRNDIEQPFQKGRGNRSINQAKILLEGIYLLLNMISLLFEKNQKLHFGWEAYNFIASKNN